MTVLGQHTIAETRDLMKVVDYRFKEVEKGFQRISEQYKQDHADEYRLLASDWTAEKKRWEDTADVVSAKLTIMNATNPATPATWIVSEPEYKRILGFVEYGESSGVERPARPIDLRGIQDRIEKILNAPIDLSKRPDMTASDVDIAAIKKLDASIKAGEAAAAKAKAAAADAAKSNTGLLILGGLGLIAGTYIYAKLS